MGDQSVKYPEDDMRYRFQSEWMRESISNRVLNNQKSKLKYMINRYNEDTDRQMEKHILKKNPEMQEMEGILEVKKYDHNKNSYKRRYCVLADGQIKEYEKQDKKSLRETICLNGEIAKVYGSKDDDKVFIVETDRWFKQKSNKTETVHRKYEFL